MNWQKVSIERLKDYKARCDAIESITEQIATLEETFEAVRAATLDATAVKGGGGNKREEALINNIAMREELKQNLEIAKREVEITEQGLSKLTKDQRLILDKFYIDRMPGYVEDLCDRLCVERSRVYALKDIALKKFTIHCYGVIEI